MRNRIKTVSGVANTYVYDGEGKRVRKYFPQGEQLRFVYGIGGQLIMEFDTSSGLLKKEYVYGGGRLLATIDSVNGTRYGYLVQTVRNDQTVRVAIGEQFVYVANKGKANEREDIFNVNPLHGGGATVYSENTKSYEAGAITIENEIRRGSGMKERESPWP